MESSPDLRQRHFARTGFAFEPRSLSAVPGMFGKSSEPFPSIDDAPPEDPRVRAAQLQHLTSNAVRESLLARGETIEDHLRTIAAGSPGLSYDRVTRILRGKTQMQLADLIFWANRFPRVRAVVAEELG